jgi:hypothetical protein
MLRIVGLLGVAAVALVGFAQADTHHNGHAKIAGKPDGKHHLHTSQHHTSHAQVKNGKVQKVDVTHRASGKQVATRKFKTRQKRHALLDLRNREQFAKGELGNAIHVFPAEDDGAAVASETAFASEASEQVAFVGFGFYFQNQWIIFWFPVNLVLGGDSGATDMDNMP